MIISTPLLLIKLSLNLNTKIFKATGFLLVAFSIYPEVYCTGTAVRCF